VSGGNVAPEMLAEVLRELNRGSTFRQKNAKGWGRRIELRSFHSGSNG